MTNHVVSKGVYIAIFTALMLLTFLTRWAATIDLGQWNIIVAVTIAVLKASLVVLFFMHLFWSDRLTHVVAVAGLFWLGILLVLTVSDYISRGWLLNR